MKHRFSSFILNCLIYGCCIGLGVGFSTSPLNAAPSSPPSGRIHPAAPSTSVSGNQPSKKSTAPPLPGKTAASPSVPDNSKSVKPSPTAPFRNSSSATSTTTQTTSLSKPSNVVKDQNASSSFTLPSNWYWGSPLEIRSSDGILLRGAFKPPRPPHTTYIVFLAGDRDGFVPSFRLLAARFGAKGYGIVAYDTRGVGLSQNMVGGKKYLIRDHIQDNDAYAKMVDDAKIVVQYLRQNKKIRPMRMIFIGSSVGANVAIMAAAELPSDIRSMVVLSPSANYHYLEPFNAAQNLGGRPLLAITSGGDSYAYSFLQNLKRGVPEATTFSVGGQAHGHQMLDSELIEKIVKWVDEH